MDIIRRQLRHKKQITGVCRLKPTGAFLMAKKSLFVINNGTFLLILIIFYNPQPFWQLNRIINERGKRIERFFIAYE
jgi:hypothetical protein